MKKAANLLTAILILASCNNPSQQKETAAANETKLNQLKPMQVDTTEKSYGADISLGIYEITKLSSELSRYRLLSTYKDKVVGFDLLLKKPAKEQMFIHNGITFLSLGDTSNNFLQALAEVYKIKKPASAFIDSVTITYANLASQVDLSKPENWIAAEIKMFFETEDDNPELFMNLDEKEGIISFPEKDSDYREGIITALSKKRK